MSLQRFFSVLFFGDVNVFWLVFIIAFYYLLWRSDILPITFALSSSAILTNIYRNFACTFVLLFSLFIPNGVENVSFDSFLCPRIFIVKHLTNV